VTLPRTEVRAATVALLKGVTAVGDRVWPTRIMPLRRGSYPAILVYTLQEDMSGSGSPPPQFRHDLTLAIEIRWCPTDADLDDLDDDAEDALDALCETVLDRLLTNPEWVAQFEEIIGISTAIGFDARGENVLMGARIVITGTYRTLWEPVVPDEFERLQFGIDAIDPADPNIRQPGPDGRIEAGADFTIPND
jgi:hypothetical protein